GKSTYMRQVALIALLARAGSYVPASRARIGPLDRIFTRIGAADDLAGGRSTFMMEMMEAGVILGAATPRSLVLMDEIGRGTSTYDGLALAWAIAHRLLTHNRAMTLFATHYFEMTRLPEKTHGVVNVHLAAADAPDGVVFLHEVRPGPASQSYGLHVAQRAGIPPVVIRHARKELAELEARNRSESQLALFVQQAEEESGGDPDAPLRAALQALDPDSLSPREALELIYQLRRDFLCPGAARASGRTTPLRAGAGPHHRTHVMHTPIPDLDRPTPLLGGLTPREFMRDYWQKKPLLVRQAIPGFQPPVTIRDVQTLARREEVESRLITHGERGWSLKHGPFRRLPPATQPNWTLLVQSVDLHDDASAALMRQFRFISDARLDDLMISIATDGGGVGPHFDSYDVFLLQGH